MRLYRGREITAKHGLGIERSVFFNSELQSGFECVFLISGFFLWHAAGAQVWLTVVLVCVCVCVFQDDLSVPLLQENLDGSSGVLFPYYDPDTHMLYIAGKVGLQSRYTHSSTKLSLK